MSIFTIKDKNPYADIQWFQDNTTKDITPKEITPKRKLRPRKLSYSKRLFSGYYLKRLKYLLYGSVFSLPSPSSNIEAWPYGTSLRFASLLHLGH